MAIISHVVLKELTVMMTEINSEAMAYLKLTLYLHFYDK